MKRTNTVDTKQLLAVVGPTVASLYTFEKKVTEAIVDSINNKSNPIEYRKALDDAADELMETSIDILKQLNIDNEEEIDGITGILRPYFNQLIDADIEMTEAIITMACGDPDRANDIFDYSQNKLTRNFRTIIKCATLYDKLQEESHNKTQLLTDHAAKESTFADVLYELNRLADSAKYDKSIDDFKSDHDDDEADDKGAGKVEAINEAIEKVKELKREENRSFGKSMEKYED